MARAGYTLPVFAAAAAVAALRSLQERQPIATVALDLIAPPRRVEIPVEQVAPLDATQALAIVRSDPGDNLDLTRYTPVWAWVQATPEAEALITIRGGEGIGRHAGGDAIYAYAKRVICENVQAWLTTAVTITIILPEGRQLAERTSNAAFGVLEGLSLLGTGGISEPLSAPEQLALYQAELQLKATRFNTLVFCVGENGRDRAIQLGINPEQILKTANWLGPLLVAAGLSGIEQLLLFGYHGKLLKLAGGIFHTHHYLADARLEILVAHAVKAQIPAAHLRPLLECATAEAARDYLQQIGQAAPVYAEITHSIDDRATRYIHTHSAATVTVGTVLFGRDRQLFAQSAQGQRLLTILC